MHYMLLDSLCVLGLRMRKNLQVHSFILFLKNLTLQSLRISSPDALNNVDYLQALLLEIFNHVCKVKDCM